MAELVCYYAIGSWAAKAYGWTSVVSTSCFCCPFEFAPMLRTPQFPDVMTLFFSVAGVIFGAFFFLLIGLYYKLVTYVLAICQMHLDVTRLDPYCTAYHTFAFPSTQVFYSISIIALFLTYYFTVPVGHERPHVGPYGWLMLLVVTVLPPGFLLYGGEQISIFILVYAAHQQE